MKQKMTVDMFLSAYLSMDAIVTLCEENGNINYTGRLGDAPFCYIRRRYLVRVEGIGDMDDLWVITTAEKKTHKG